MGSGNHPHHATLLSSATAADRACPTFRPGRESVHTDRREPGLACGCILRRDCITSPCEGSRALVHRGRRSAARADHRLELRLFLPLLLQQAAKVAPLPFPTAHSTNVSSCTPLSPAFSPLLSLQQPRSAWVACLVAIRASRVRPAGHRSATLAPAARTAVRGRRSATTSPSPTIGSGALKVGAAA